jgi:hypothetical protein
MYAYLYRQVVETGICLSGHLITNFLFFIIMETLKIDFYQDETRLSFEFETQTELNQQKLNGSTLNELFKWISLQKDMGAKGLKLSQPINIKVEHNGKLFDTGNAKKQLQQKLKVNSSAKSMRKFAQRYTALISYMCSPFVALTVDEVLETLD